ncbi:uncharacterized protein LOC116341417 [Contarinia nasturtii]|uniref:uncharacterized protein LOC116341417 n=1 Tax=Contarinia nasturtii TaxID=265458 RepID=UPI0012D4887A|nr:uncharacterized protein LOC116341417 [Contarinia nasturtii]
MHYNENVVASIEQSLANLSVQEENPTWNAIDYGMEYELLNHVILPRFLPQMRRFSTYQHGFELLSRMTEVISANEKYIPASIIQTFWNMYSNHIISIPLTVCDNINALKSNDTFAMYVKGQDCMFTVHMPPIEADQIPDESTPVIVATFQYNFHPSDINETFNDFEINYPVDAFKVKFSKLLRSIEFANQLCYLNTYSGRQKNLVTEWLVGTLCDENAQTAGHNEFPPITKKLRSEILGRNIDVAFQRSHFYLSMKSFLQHNLTILLGAKVGKIVYKIIMLQFIVRMCNVFKFQENSTFDVSLIQQIMAKMCRRIEKLLQLIDDLSTNLIDDLEEMKVIAIDETKSTIEFLRTKIDIQINDIQINDETNLTPLTDLNFEKDAIQAVKKLRCFLEQRKSIQKLNNASSYPPRTYTRLNFKDLQYSEYQKYFNNVINQTEIDIQLIDFENYILCEMKLNEIPNDPRYQNEMRKIYFSYDTIAKKRYYNEPLGTSKMILVQLKLIAMFDVIACKRCPLLLNHRSGINPNIIKSLLLPQYIEMKVADELEEYFAKRNKSAIGPSLIEEQTITAESFSSNYAAQDARMQTVRNKILAEQQRNIDILIEKLESERQKVADLRLKMEDLSHNHHDTTINIRRKKSSDCRLCNLTNACNQFRVMQYVKAMPRKVYKQNGVVFEICPPPEIINLRDTLYNFAIYCSGKPGGPVSSIRAKWTDFAEISRFYEMKSFHIYLASTSFETKRAYHVNNSNETFILKNGHDCTYALSMPDEPMADNAIKDVCALKVEAGTVYEGLQWMVNSTSHTENEVLATQFKCPNGLSLDAYKHFGFLRADGHRLQLHKLYASIATEALPFEEPSVQSLVIQSLWEYGEKGEHEGSSVSEAHEEFKHTNFALSMIKLLDKFIDQQKKNWVHPFKLLMTVIISARVMEINDEEIVADAVVTLLDKLRFFALNWIEKIQETLFSFKNPNVTNEYSLRNKLALVAICGALTFSIHSSHKFFEKTLQKNAHNGFSSARIWLEFIITLNNNMLLQEMKCLSKQPLLESYMSIFLHYVRRIGIQMESTIKKLINENELLSIIEKQWKNADRRTFESFYFHPTSPQLCCIKINEKLVTIDIITGSFLCNSLSISRLPMIICDYYLYRRVFDRFILDVQPEDNQTFTTIQKYNERIYKFFYNYNEVIITEIRDDGHEMELVHPSILQSEIPYLLIQNYSHWWNKEENTIDFRPVSFLHKLFSTEDGVDYRLNLNDNTLIHLKTQKQLLDITSPSYVQIVSHLSRLECPHFINITLENPDVVIIEIDRMNLKFKIDKNIGYDILSNEFSRMRVSLQQNCGTLFGLNNGLILESVDTQLPFNKLLLMPHGKLQVKRTENHVCVHINTNEMLSNPPFHLYRFDTVCRQLTAINNNYSAWLYLSYLHAITSHNETEPFTGLSGTERALQILQSGYVWSSTPYDPASIQLLFDFMRLAPKRILGNCVQMIEWPYFIPLHAAQDSYLFIAKKLLEDSQRLHRLHFVEKKIESNFDTHLKLNKRDYFRHMELWPNLRVSEIFIPRPTFQMSLPTKLGRKCKSENTRIISSLYHKKEYMVSHRWNMSNFFHQVSNPKCLELLNNIADILNHCSFEKMVDLWIPLYESARIGFFNDEEFVLICSLLAHMGQPIDAILALQAIHTNKNEFTEIKAPDTMEFNLNDELYDKNTISFMLHTYARKNGIFVTDDVTRMTEIIDAGWPSNRFHSVGASDVSHIFSGAFPKINLKLNSWYNNLRLNEFIAQVSGKLEFLAQSMTNVNIERLHDYNVVSEKHWPRFEVNFESKMWRVPNNFSDNINEAEKIWNLEMESNKSSQEWWNIYESITKHQIEKHFIDAKMHTRLVPSLVLPKILSHNIDHRLKMVIGALAITIAKEQREQRIERLKDRPQSKPAFDREMENKPYINWKPSERPEWLLFEIEQNLTIRRIQSEVAKRMIDPLRQEATKHSIMQLNMGEGKTAVITPIIASILANGQQACQITVLKSLFSTNAKSLRQYLGGMLNRRIYTFPCRRDLPINDHLTEILDIYKECKAVKGIIVSLPEYQLSFQLKMYESIQSHDYGLAEKYLSVQSWLNSNIRGILDESDAILKPKYQLVYTVGNQLPLDGGVPRWLIIQSVLKCVPYHMARLYKKHGPDSIEYDENYVRNNHVFGALKTIRNRSDIFNPCRILKESVFEELKEAILDDLFADKLDITWPEVNTETKHLIKRFLSQCDAPFEVICKDLSKDVQNTILILCGLLQFGVLRFMLVKRWRVNYGVNKNGLRKMAIPFRAKDVAAENTEFGHSDIAIGLTQLSYYYSGLSDDQLKQVFENLSASLDTVETYSKWTKDIPVEFIDPSIRSYSGVNLSDPHQRDKVLFPLFRFNMHVIDFWLSKIVYPHEAKTFENKLICTAWDLCNEFMVHPTTGFSGTSDTKNVLPLPVAQNDLEELENTNENVRETLLRHENQCYKNLPANVSAREILKNLVASKIPVLLDSGALMLELNNKQVAQEWLKYATNQSYDAGVYFDEKDVLQTIDRNNVVAEFDCSVYRENLDRCLIYLDDTHTRGTDLKFPLGLKACVTLSGEITRDKTVQACMRMRQLGKGHSIEFWASFEADLRIREVCNLSRNDHIRNEDVITFICHNSKHFEMENIVHWSAGAYNYTKKIAAYMLYESLSDMLDLYNGCNEKEFVTLRAMYSDRKEQSLSDIVSSKFNHLQTKYGSRENIHDYIADKYLAVNKKISEDASNVKRFAFVLDEEQEKEIEYEPETERQIERPPAVDAIKPIFNENLTLLILNGLNTETSSIAEEILFSLDKGLLKTKLYQDFAQDEPWSSHISVTNDFIKVLRDDSSIEFDEFLRPVSWIARIDMDNGAYRLVLLSSFECHHLLPYFRRSHKSTLYMYRPRLCNLHSDLLDNHDLRISARTETVDIDENDSAQIAVFSGSMYFRNETEQNAYCHFLGLIPRPRTSEQNDAFEKDIIKPNGFVPPEHRQLESTIEYVGQCKFKENPVNVAKSLIEAHNGFLRKESHAAFILGRGTKQTIQDQILVDQMARIDLDDWMFF